MKGDSSFTLDRAQAVLAFTLALGCICVCISLSLNCVSHGIHDQKRKIKLRHLVYLIGFLAGVEYGMMHLGSIYEPSGFDSPLRRVHISVTGRLSCPGNTSYNHLRQMVTALRSAGHEVHVYTAVTFTDRSKQAPFWDLLMDDWNTTSGVKLQWGVTYTAEEDLKRARTHLGYDHCVQLGYETCTALLINLMKLKETWVQMKRVIVEPKGIIIRTRPDLIMIGRHNGEGNWITLPPLRFRSTVVVSKFFRYAKWPSVEDNFAIMTPDAAETYYTLLDRIHTMLDSVSRGGNHWNPERLFGTNLQKLDVVMRDWKYDLQGRGGYHNNPC